MHNHIYTHRDRIHKHIQNNFHPVSTGKFPSPHQTLMLIHVNDIEALPHILQKFLNNCYWLSYFIVEINTLWVKEL